MFRHEMIPWIYEQLRRTGYYDVQALHTMERNFTPAEASKVACRLFLELPKIEQHDIRHAYLKREIEIAELSIAKHRQSTA